MQMRPLGNCVLVERVKPDNQLLEGITLEEGEDRMFIYRVKVVGSGRILENGVKVEIDVKPGDEVAIAGQVLPFDFTMYGGGDWPDCDGKLYLAKAETIVAVIGDRSDWKRPNILVPTPYPIHSGKYRQAMHAGAAKFERVS